MLDTATEKLSRAWGVVSHLNGVADTPELRAAYNEALPKVTEFWTRLGSDERLYAKYKAIDSGHAQRRTAPGAQERDPQLRPGRRRTHGRGQDRFAAIQERQAELSQKFSENALDATDAYAYYAGEERTRRRAAGRGPGRPRRRRRRKARTATSSR